MTSVTVRFDLVVLESDSDHDRTGFRVVSMPCVPLPGELVNLRGWPCRVIERGWAIDDEVDANAFAYVRVVSANIMEILRELAMPPSATDRVGP